MARVNNVNYIVNYKNFARARDLISHVHVFSRPQWGDVEGATALYTHSFNSKTPQITAVSSAMGPWGPF